MNRIATATLLLVFALPLVAQAVNTASCDSKRGWQRSIVRGAVHDWFRGHPDSGALVELIQAEHGIVACSLGQGRPQRLHTVTLPRGLELDQLGAVLLANELEWSGLIPEPERGLAGGFFRVQLHHPVGEPERYVGESR